MHPDTLVAISMIEQDMKNTPLSNLQLAVKAIEENLDYTTIERRHLSNILYMLCDGYHGRATEYIQDAIEEHYETTDIDYPGESDQDKDKWEVVVRQLANKVEPTKLWITVSEYYDLNGVN